MPFQAQGKATVDIETGRITIEREPKPPKEPRAAPAPKPSPPEPKAGTNVGPRRLSSGNWETGPNPRAPIATGPSTAVASAPRISEQAALYYAWSGLWIKDAWRPVTLFVAEEIKSYAIEESAYLLTDIAAHYAYGERWAASVGRVWARGALWSGFALYAFLVADPAEIGLGPEPFEQGDRQRIKEYIDDLEKQQKLEKLPSTIKIPFNRLPDEFFEGAPQTTSPFGPSTELQRRRAIFKDQTLTREQAREALVSGATKLISPDAGRLYASSLWLYDLERVEKEGLSDEAFDLLERGELLSRSLEKRISDRAFPNACMLTPLTWNGTPSTWTCSLPGRVAYNSCSCMAQGPGGLFPVNGVPVRLVKGQVCRIPKQGACPMLRSEVAGSLCTCGSGSRGQVRVK